MPAGNVRVDVAALEEKTPKAVRQPVSYVLGPDDQITIRVLQVPEIAEKPVRIDLDGNIELPYLGQVRAAGLTAEQLKKDLTERLKTFVREPQVSVGVEEFRSQPVSVIGAVNTPGVQQIRGRKTLVEVVSMAGGLRLDCGNTLNITRHMEWGKIPLPSAALDATGQFSVAKVDLKSLMEAKNPAENILVQPDDVISVPRAEMVYVVGEVPKAGGFVLQEREKMYLLEALALAGGVNRTAAPQNTRILRKSSSNADGKIEIPVDLTKVLNGQLKDVPLQPQDIVFIPGSAAKRASLRAIEAAIQMGTGVAIFHR